jgi:hypothetical protein
MGFCDLRLQLLDGKVMDGRRTGKAHVDLVVGKRIEVGGLRGLADIDEALEGILYVLARIGDDPVSSWKSVGLTRPFREVMYLMIANFSSIALLSAWFMAIWRRSDSQGHAAFGGALHIAQLGS